MTDDIDVYVWPYVAWKARAEAAEALLDEIEAIIERHPHFTAVQAIDIARILSKRVKP